MSDVVMSTRIVYTVEGEHVPYRVTANTEPHKLTLSLFKTVTQRFLFRFYFLSYDQEFGTLKEEVTDEDAVCPSSQGLVQAWLTPLTFSDDSTKLSPLTCTSNNMTGLSGNTGTSSNSRVISGCSSSHSSAYHKSNSVSYGESFFLPNRVAGGFMTSSPSSWVNAEEQRCRSAEMYREYERQIISREVLSDTCAEIMARGHWNYGSIYGRGTVDAVAAEIQQEASAVPGVANAVPDVASSVPGVASAVPGAAHSDPAASRDLRQVDLNAQGCDDPANNLNKEILQESTELVDLLKLAAPTGKCSQNQLKESAKETKFSTPQMSDTDCLKSDKLYPSHKPKDTEVAKEVIRLSSKWKSLSLQKTAKPLIMKNNTLPTSNTDFSDKKLLVLKDKRGSSQLKDKTSDMLYTCNHDLLTPGYQTVSEPCSFCENLGSVYVDSISTTDIFTVSPLSHSPKKEDSSREDQEVYEECTYRSPLKDGQTATNLNQETDTSCPFIGLNPADHLQAASPSMSVSTSKRLAHHRTSSPPEHIHSLTQPLLHEQSGSGNLLLDETEIRLRSPGLSVPPDLKAGPEGLQKDLQQTLTDLNRPCSYRPEVKDREWLGCTIPNAVVGSELISWLRSTKKGLESYTAAKHYAQKMLDNGVIWALLSSETSFIDEWYYTVA